MQVAASAPIVPDTGRADAFLPLAERACVSLPPLQKGVQITLQLRVDDAALAGEPYEISLYESGRPEVYKPNILVQKNAITLTQGSQNVTLTCPANSKGNVMISLPARAGLSIGQTAKPLPGVLGTWGENTLGEKTFAPAVCLAGADGFYDASALTDGYTRPYGGMHLWASPLEGCVVTLSASEPIEAGQCVLYMDNALYRSYNNLRPLRDTLWREYIHPTLLRDFTVYAQGPDGEKALSVRENIQRCVRLDLGGMRLTQLRIVPERTWGAPFVSIHEIALFAPDKED